VPFAAHDDFLDIESVNYYRMAVASGSDAEEVLSALRLGSRDNARSPMQWDAGDHAGFTTGIPWSRVNPNHTEINAEAALADDDSVFHHYRRVIELRHTEPAVAHGDFHMLAPDHPKLYAFTRAHEGTELLVLANFSSDELPLDDLDGGGEDLDLDAWKDSTLLLGNVGEPAAPTAPLRAWEARVLRR